MENAYFDVVRYVCPNCDFEWNEEDEIETGEDDA